MHKASLVVGSFLALTAVILGAFGAHYLKSIFTTELLSSFETGVKYQFYNAFALLFLGIYASFSKKPVDWIFRYFIIGTFLFSGSIYALCFLKGTMQIGLGGIGILTPIGGVFQIVAWLLLLFNIIGQKQYNKEFN